MPLPHCRGFDCRAAGLGLCVCGGGGGGGGGGGEGGGDHMGQTYDSSVLSRLL